MKRYKWLALAGVALGLTACNDFLSIEPSNEIVLERYWTEEKDVNSVLMSCYAQLESSDCMNRMVVWGELRSDNMTNGSGISNDLLQITKENILETNRMTSWESFYQCINRCNSVIHYAPVVAKKDPNLTESELAATLAEAHTLRALCYFYLIRTFRDVPYVTNPSIEDNQVYRIPATPFNAVLDSLIADVEAVAPNAVRSYGEESVENTCRITRWACYALLADMYLWKGDYENCIRCCDLVIDRKIKEYEDAYEKNPTTLGIELYGKFPLISESTGNSNFAGTTYNTIFGTGNSFESIFELNFVNNQSVTNSTVASYYGQNSNSSGQFAVSSPVAESPYTGTASYFAKSDCRFLENILSGTSVSNIQKYVAQTVSFRTNTSTGAAPVVQKTVRSNNFANWIIYRLTDVMLMRAEAEVEMAGDVELGATLSDEQTLRYREAFNCVSAVWKRANNKRTATADTLVYDDYATSRAVMEDLVLDERQRELMFEGKRWFDLVRLCRREGSNTRMVNKVIPKFKDNTVAIRIKLSAPDALFYPYWREELKQNPYLKQNPAYETGDEMSKN